MDIVWKGDNRSEVLGDIQGEGESSNVVRERLNTLHGDWYDI